MPEGIRSVSVRDMMRELRQHPDAVVLDVRTPDEISRHPGMQISCPMDFLDSDFEQRVASLDRAVPYYLYDDTGKRSRMAAARMKERGFLLVAWVEGGWPALKAHISEHGEPEYVPF